MWIQRCQQLNPTIWRVRFETNGTLASYAAVIQGWQHDEAFRTCFLNTLITSPFKVFRWETRPVTPANASQPFECMVIDSPGIAREPNHQTFQNYFQTDQSAVVFTNLGQDAMLVVPCPLSPSDKYGHLGAFVRHAPEPQQHALWSLVGQTMAKRLINPRSSQPIWLNTAGGGVPWLHVRLDDRPKYYHYAPYRSNQCDPTIS